MSTEHLINRLPEKWENKIIPLMSLHDKFVLGGSIALYILKMMDYNFEERTPDLDFSLIEPFEEAPVLNSLSGYKTPPSKPKASKPTSNNITLESGELSSASFLTTIFILSPSPIYSPTINDAVIIPAASVDIFVI